MLRTPTAIGKWIFEMRNILVLCKSNAARSIMVETCINATAAEGWRAFSAGSHPEAQINTYTVMALRERGFAIEHDRQPQSWDVFCGERAPRFDVVLTVCEDVSWEKLPAWPGAPRLLHWALPDPTLGTCTPSERADMFRVVLDLVEMKVREFLAEERCAISLEGMANDNRNLVSRRWGT